MIRILPSSVVLSLAALTPIQGVGHNAPSFEAAGWVNHIGERPTLRLYFGIAASAIAVALLNWRSTDAQ